MLEQIMKKTISLIILIAISLPSLAQKNIPKKI